MSETVKETVMRLEDFTPFVDGLDHPEGVAWGPDGFVYAGGEAGQIYRIALDTGEYQQVATTGGFTLGLALDADNTIYTCNHQLHKVMRVTPAGAVSVYSGGSPDRPLRTPNYPVFDRAGNLYVSDSGEFGKNDGCLFRIRPGGQTDVASESLRAFPNGMALGPGGDELYVVLSTLPGVVKVALNTDGPVGEPQPVVELPDTVPDGVAFDEDGSLYIACYAPNEIYRLSPSGKLETLVADWMNTTLPTPTNLAFCGPDRRTLVTAGLARWHLCKARMPVAGLPVLCPKL
jgi:gluconolactonase